MLEHHNFIKIVEKDSFINNFYKKHAETVVYERRFENIMEAFSVVFRLSSNYILKKYKDGNRIDIVARKANTYPGSTFPVKYEHKVEEKERWAWILKHKDTKHTSFFSNKFRFILNDDSVNIDVSNCKKVLEDKQLNKFIVEKNNAFFSDCRIIVNSLDDLEEVLGRLLVLIDN